MEIVPQFWLLTRRAQSRIFQHLTVPDILKKVLAGLDVTYEIQGSFEPRDYCVQYRETDFNFACRLIEEEGIYYFFKHANGSHKLVLANTPQSHPAVPGNSTIVYEELGGGNREDLRIFAWEKVQELRAGKVTLWDHCFELPHKHLEADKTILDSVPVGDVTHKLKVGGNDKLEIYDYPGEYAQRFDGINKGGGEQPAEVQKIYTDNKRTVGIRMEEEALPSLVIQGDSNVRQLVSGYKLTLDRHFNGDGDYVVTSVVHTVTSSDFRSNGRAGLQYRNHFTCIPFALPYRPQRSTPKPFVQGSQTAVVVGPAGEEIFTDKYSRVKVQFHWDRQGQNNMDSSCWVRVSTLWAGKQWGVIHIPRIGQEVIVDFLEGDPDQPIITGSVYNADMMPPYKLPDNKTQSGVKSRSSLKGTPENFNEIRFEDKKGSEEVYIHAERDHNQVTEHDRSEEVRHNRSLVVGNDKSELVKHDKSIQVKNDETTAIDGNRTEKVGKDETITIAGNRTETVDKDEALTVKGMRTATISKNDALTVESSRDVSVKQNDSLTVSQDRTIAVSGNMAMTVDKQYSNSVTGSIVIQSDKDILLKCGQASILLKSEGKVEIAGVKLDIKMSGGITKKGSTVGIN
jgi:type VI secretion system secreted protein VgrG